MTLKNNISAAVKIIILLSSSITFAGTIVGSSHDFRGYIWNRSGEICNPCHAPHKTKTLPTPLWNYELTTQTYILYGKTHSAMVNEKVNDFLEVL